MPSADKRGAQVETHRYPPNFHNLFFAPVSAGAQVKVIADVCVGEVHVCFVWRHVKLMIMQIGL